MAQVQFPAMEEYFKEFFSLIDHILPIRPEPVWQKMARSPLNGNAQPKDIEEGRSPPMDRRWLI